MSRHLAVYNFGRNENGVVGMVFRFIVISAAIATIWAKNAYATDNLVYSDESFLFELGYNPGAVDGFVDQNTHSAISSSQIGRGLLVTGGMDTQGRRALGQEILEFRAKQEQHPPESSQNLPKETLPETIRREVGHIWLFSDYRTLPIGMSAFLGPGPGGDWSKPHQSLVWYRVYSLDAFHSNGVAVPQYLTGEEKSHPFNANGIGLNGPYSGPAPDLAMVCVVHAPRSAPARLVYSLSFWRAEPLRFDPTTGSKSYDAAIGPELGWAVGSDPCQNAFQSLDADTKAALRH